MRHLSRLAGFGITVLLAGLIFSASAFAAPTYGYRVLHHEAIDVATRKGAGASEHLSFEAYGRRFEVTVAPNERIRRGMPANVASTTMPMQGTVDGLAGSWVRITRSASGLRGMVFDGHEMYAVEPASEVAPVSVEPMSATSGETVVYRLADALMPVETMKCELAKPDSTPDTPATAADALQQLTSELHTFQIEAATAEATALKQVRVGVVGDFEFVSQFTTSTPEDAIVARMNIVDGIFSSQLGVKVSLATPTLFRSDTDPFTKSAASDLLSELRTYRAGSPAQQALGITHLMTGRNLDGSTVGIAYIKGLCSAQFGASLSQGTFNTTQSALIAAHEIGHNFGAPHDGESGSACEATAQTFLMAPQLNGSNQFSPCSIQEITPVVNGAQCLTAYSPPDASISAPTTLSATVGTAFVASFTVRAQGDDASSSVTATVTVPATLTVNSATANGGSCTAGAGTVSCSLGTLATGDVRQVDLNLTPTAAGAVALSISVASPNDANTSNNAATINITASGASTTPPVTTPPPSSGSSGGGGGGGSMDFLMLAALGGTLLLRRKRH
jgi:hypothetical protein